METKVYCRDKRTNILGNKFGRLTPLKIKGRNKHGSILWDCICDCGKHYSVHTSNLKKGHTQSCGCLHKEVRKKCKVSVEDRITTIAWNVAKRSAITRGYKFAISKEDVKKIISENCCLSNDPPSNKIIINGKIYHYSGIDRFNNNEGYIPTNIFPCGTIANRGKSTLTFKSYVEHCHRVVENMKNRGILENGKCKDITWFTFRYGYQPENIRIGSSSAEKVGLSPQG